MRGSNVFSFLTIAAMGLSLHSTQALAVDAVQYDLRIERQSLSTALQEFAQQSGVQIIFFSKVTDGYQAPSLKGKYTASGALHELLNASELTFRELNATTIEVQPKAAMNGVKKAAEPVAVGASSGSAGNLQLAQAEPGTDVQAAETMQSPATAVSRETGRLEVEEIIVTAQKREERLQDVPAAVTAINAGTLSRTGMLRIADYQALVPGLNVNDGTAGGGQMSPSIRGITTGAGGRPTVGIFVDDVPVGRATSGGFMPDIDPAELERIEVLRGPQGTLFGGGTMGGLIRFVTKSPDFDAFSGRVEAGGTSVNDGGTGWSARGSINAPISDNLAIRASAFTREDAGFINNLQTSRDASNVRRYDGGRVSLGARIGEDWAVRLSAATQHIRADANPLIDVVRATGQHLCGGLPCGELETRRAPGSDNSDDRDTVYDLRVTGNLGWADFLSSTAYDERDYRSNFDYSPVLGGFASLIFGVPNLGAAVLSVQSSERFTQEFRLNSRPGRRFDWQVGAFYTDERSFGGQDARVFDLTTGGPTTPPLPDLQTGRGPDRFEELAGFANMTINLTSRFDVTVGARYSQNVISASSVTTGRLTGAPLTTITSYPEGSEESLTYLVSPQFKITDDLLVYARMATGFRPGGPNAPNPTPTVPASFEHDSVVNYELGLKGETPDRSLRFGAALYYIDWEDTQVRQTASGISYYINGSRAHSQGFELELDWRPLAALTISGNLSFNEAELDQPLGTSLTAVPAGSRLPDTPRWASYLSTEYRVPLGAVWNGSLGAAWHYVDERMGSLAASPFVLPSYRTIDLLAGVSNEKYSVALFARNVADERGYLSSFPFPPLEQVAVIQPRTFGISFAASF